MTRLTQPQDARETQNAKGAWCLPPCVARPVATVAPRLPIARTQMHETTDWYPRSSK